MTNLENNTIEQSDNNVFFFNSFFEEVMELLLESHEYFEHYGDQDQIHGTPAYKLLYSNEMSRLTIRMTSVMAWLMVRKSVLAGQVTSEEAAEKYRLEAREVGLYRCEDAMQYLPTYMAHLLEESHRIYTRIARLDDIAYGQEMDNGQIDIFSQTAH